jgi:hypothetical protein
MSYGKFLCSIVPLSLGTGVLLFLLALALMPPGTGGRYAALSFDAAVPDRRIGELLSTVTADYISESTQYVFLDDFGTLREIPLDRYGESVEPFDPRNDGYAEKLRSFFVRDGKRIFFVPLGKSPSGAAGGFAVDGLAVFEKRIAPLFAGIPFSADYVGGGKPLFLWLALAVGAGVGALLLRKPRLPAAASLPALCALAPGGPPSLALGAILAGFLFLLAEPAGEFFVSLRYRVNDPEFRSLGRRIARDILGPFRFRLILGAFLLAAYGGGCAAGGTAPLLGFAVFAVATGLTVFALLAESNRGEAQDHVRFLPVIIMKPPSPVPAFSRIVLVYFLASAMAAALPLLFPGLRSAISWSAISWSAVPRSAGLPAPFSRGVLPTAEEYLAHAAFQAGFSYRPLGGGEGTYRHYVPGDDGLLSEAPMAERAPPVIRPFPLRDLADFLDDPKRDGVPVTAGAAVGDGGGISRGMLRGAPLLIALVLALPALRGPGWGRNKKKKMVVYPEKRIAA